VCTLDVAANAGDPARVEAVDDPGRRSWATPGDQPLGRAVVLAACSPIVMTLYSCGMAKSLRQ